ncbi:protein TolB [Striga asiatica]|uniref:Protein TolB n=1 Tax=Striga asiatica TaxID=4170 RepID=A0A5A7QV57_STRAF|nr:protein TolB [Striga asiatica]
MQLKGVLHSGKPPEHNQVRHRNFIYDEAPVVIVRTLRSSSSSPINRRRGINCSPSSGGRNQISYNSNSPAPSPHWSPSAVTTARNESSAIGRKSNSLVKPKPLSVETQRIKPDPVENRRSSLVQSPIL